ncbi:hypothetical protein F4779DRAFT_631925 [Xylariaceae sp. FL0662B]|nr:hypothetical protein F4779DRAFT_631925 [Xylariaceae sp. FL0662B]
MRIWPRHSSSTSATSHDVRLDTITRQITPNPPSSSSSPSSSRPGTPGESRLAVLPLELQFLIISELDLQSMITLRQTSRLYRHLITADLVRKHFIHEGRCDPVLKGCCAECLCMPELDRLILDTSRDDESWRSICFRCWRSRLYYQKQRKHWPLVELANGTHGYICQFCTWPVQSGNSDGSLDLLHAACRVRKFTVVVIWLVMAFIQFGLGMLAAVLAWTMYKHQMPVLVPASIDFALAIVALVIFVIRTGTTNNRTYTRALATELVITFIRIPPVTYTARETVISENTQPGALPKFSFGVFLINLIFRLLDMVGYLLLNCGYDPQNIFQAGLTMRKKVLYASCTFMVWFAFIPF